MNERQRDEARVMVLLGIINQLLTTRYSKLFHDKPLNQSQFGVLNHFTHTPDKSWLISDLANVMELNQPGITKVVTVLLKRHLLKATTDKNDKRKKHLTITAKGIDLCQEMIQSLLPDVSRTFTDWQDDELFQLKGQMEKLMRWLDDNRL